MCVGLGAYNLRPNFILARLFLKRHLFQLITSVCFQQPVSCFLAVMDLAVAAASRRVAAPVLEEDFVVLWMQVRFLFSEAEVSMHLS